MGKKGLLILLPLLVSSCAPKFCPSVPMPNSFTESDSIEMCGGEEGSLQTWWHQFNDPCLDMLIDEALTWNFDLNLARERICESRAVYQIEFGRLLPEVNFDLLAKRMRNTETLTDSPFLGGNFFNLFRVGFDASWELDLFGKNINLKEAAAFDSLAAMAEARDIHVTVTGEVARSYVEVRKLQRLEEIAREQVRNEEELLELAQTRYESGLVSFLDPLQAKSLLEQRRSDVYGFQLEKKQTIYSMAILLGRPPSSMMQTLEAAGPIPCANHKIPIGLPCELLCRRGDVRRAEFLVDASGARLLAARKELLPTVTFGAAYYYLSSFVKELFKAVSRDWVIEPEAIFPLFRGGRILGQIRVESSLQRQALIEYERSVVEALVDVENALVAYFEEAGRYDATSKEVEANRASHMLALDLYQSGLVEFSFVLDVMRNLFDSETRLAESQANMMIGLIGVYKALGGGWEC